MGLLIYIFGIAWFSNMFTWGFTPDWFIKLKDKYLDYKIFNCTTCFSFYFSFFLSLIVFNNIFFIVLLSFTISFVSKIIEKKYMEF